jgi:hypothetical protein
MFISFSWKCYKQRSHHLSSILGLLNQLLYIDDLISMSLCHYTPHCGNQVQPSGYMQFFIVVAAISTMTVLSHHKQYDTLLFITTILYCIKIRFLDDGPSQLSDITECEMFLCLEIIIKIGNSTCDNLKDYWLTSEQLCSVLRQSTRYNRFIYLLFYCKWVLARWQ